MNRFRLWISLLLVVLIGGICGWMALAPSSAAQQEPQMAGQQGSNGDSNTPPNSINKDSMTTAQEQQMRVQENEARINRQLQAFQQKPGNISLLLQAIRQQCSIADCMTLLKQTLASYPDKDFAALLQNILERMPAYEQAMQSTIMSTSLSPQQRYDRIWQLREQMLGKQEAALAFGQERAYAEYQLQYGNLMQQAKNMSAQQRIDALHKLQQQAAAQYPELLANVEGSNGNYEKELQLSLIGIEDTSQRQQITQQLRQKYFKPEQAANMQARDQQVAQQQTQVKQYQAELAQLKQDMNQKKASLSANEWQQQYELRVTQLRLKHFPAS
jgi:HAMP domain-containing protein